MGPPTPALAPPLSEKQPPEWSTSVAGLALLPPKPRPSDV